MCALVTGVKTCALPISLFSMRIPTDPKTPASAVRFFQIDTEQAGQRVDNFLIRVCKGVPQSHLYKAIRGGEVRVNKGRVQRSEYRSVGKACVSTCSSRVVP